MAVSPPSSVLLQWLVLVAAVVAVAAVANSSNSSNGATETVDNSQPEVEESADDDGGGGGVLDAVMPFRAIQLYNAVAGYLEYFYDIVIAPITGNFFFQL